MSLQMASEAEVEIAAQIAMAGMDPMRWLESTDSFERNLMQSVANRRLELAKEERKELAILIVQNFAKNIKVK